MSVLNGKRFLILDVETSSGRNEDGHPFDPDNRLLFVGAFDGNSLRIWNIEFSEKPYGEALASIQSFLDNYDVIVAFNAKFDLHWLRRYGIKYADKRIWDLQYAEFCLSGQQWRMPSCDDSCTKRGIQGKLEFDHSIAHSEAEWSAYLHRDLVCEWNLLLAQIEALNSRPALETLIWYGSQDLKVTQEMEWNGLKYDVQKSLEIGDQMLQDVALIDSILYDFAPWPDFNWGSPNHVSAVLYGGRFSRKRAKSENYEFTYKSGKTVTKTRWVDDIITFPRLVEPLKGTGAKKNATANSEADYYFSTDEGVLKKLKAVGTAKQIINLLLKRRGLEKSIGTYYHGIPNLMEKMGWEDQRIHGQLNHCVAVSGRLSSSKPNQQNLEAKMRQCIVSRFQTFA